MESTLNLVLELSLLTFGLFPTENTYSHAEKCFTIQNTNLKSSSEI